MNTEDITPPTPHRERSLGFWLRAADAAIAAELGRVLADEGLDRRDWAVLNVLAGELDAPGLADRVRHGGKRVRSLAARGWAIEADDAWTLTDTGRRERDRIQGLVDEVRARVRGAVPEADLATTIASLETITHTLGWDEAAPRRFGPRGRRGFGPRCGGFGRGFGHGHGHGFGHGHGEHPQHSEHQQHGGHQRHRGERAFERGFTAGFRAGRDAA